MNKSKHFFGSTVLALSIASMTISAGAVHAGENNDLDTLDTSKADPKPLLVGAASGATMGALAAGPVGAFVGGIIGVLVGNDVDQDERLAQSQDQLMASQRALSELNSELIAWQQKAMLQPVSVKEPAPLILPELTTSIQFRTGEASVESFYAEQLSLVSDMLQSFNGLSVHITGYADARGSEDDNVLLSKQRAEAIMGALINSGVNQTQISISAMGEKGATQQQGAGDTEALFFDRKAVLNIAPTDKILTAKQ